MCEVQPRIGHRMQVEAGRVPGVGGVNWRRHGLENQVMLSCVSSGTIWIHTWPLGNAKGAPSVRLNCVASRTLALLHCNGTYVPSATSTPLPLPTSAMSILPASSFGMATVFANWMMIDLAVYCCPVEPSRCGTPSMIRL